MKISRQRCFNHSIREAAARCLECGRFFCRECATEHRGRVVCAGCLQGLTAKSAATGHPILFFCWRSAQLLLASLALWLFFYLIAQALLSVPTSYHQGGGWAEQVAAELDLIEES